jgi:FkbM family methyltransferase
LGSPAPSPGTSSIEGVAQLDSIAGVTAHGRFSRPLKRAIGAPFRAIGYDITRRRDPLAVQARLLRDVARPVIFDGGANVGDTAAAYRRVFPGARVFAFEPFPPVFGQLSARFATDSGVQCFPTALAASEGTRELHSYAAHYTNSLLRAQPAAAEHWGKTLFDARGSVAVECTTIDVMRSRLQLDSIDILKLDLQGSEAEALRGASASLREGRIRLVYSELLVANDYEGQSRLEDLIGLLGSAGYRLFGLFDIVHDRDGMLLQMDGLFVRQEVLPRPAT